MWNNLSYHNISDLGIYQAWKCPNFCLSPESDGMSDPVLQMSRLSCSQLLNICMYEYDACDTYLYDNSQCNYSTTTAQHLKYHIRLAKHIIWNIGLKGPGIHKIIMNIMFTKQNSSLTTLVWKAQECVTAWFNKCHRFQVETKIQIFPQGFSLYFAIDIILKEWLFCRIMSHCLWKSNGQSVHGPIF